MNSQADAGQVLRHFADAIDTRDWHGLTALLAPDLTATLVHSGETFDRDGFVRLNADYPGGPWRFHVEEIVDAGERGVLRARTTDGQDTYFVASFVTVADSVVTELLEVWTEAVKPVSRPR